MLIGTSNPPQWCGEFEFPIRSRQSLVGNSNPHAALESIDLASAPLIPNFAKRMPRSDAKFGIGALQARSGESDARPRGWLMRAPSARLRGEGRGEGARPRVQAWGKSPSPACGRSSRHKLWRNWSPSAGEGPARKSAPTSPRKRGEVEPAARLCINMSGICCSAANLKSLVGNSNSKPHRKALILLVLL